MAKYNFFISYCAKDGREHARLVYNHLKEKGYTAFFDEECLMAGSIFKHDISNAISTCDCFLPIITEGYETSKLARKELIEALETSKSRCQLIIPLFAHQDAYRFLPPEIRYLQGLDIRSEAGLQSAIHHIDDAFGCEIKSATLYEKLVEYKNIQNNDKIATTVCELINLSLQKWIKSQILGYREMQNICKEIYRLYIELEAYTGRYDEESRKIAHLIIDTLDRVEYLLNEPSNHPYDNNLFHSQIYFVSFAIRILYSDRTIRQECADILTNGDVNNACSVERYINRQALFVKAYTDLAEQMKDDCGFSNEDISFIKETKEFIFENNNSFVPFVPKQKQDDVLSENDYILLSVAKFMQEGNKLFDVLQSRGIAGDFLSCLLTSYERLKNYCEIVGAKDVAADCVDRIVEIRNSIERSTEDAPPDERAENGIKSLLGFTLKNSGNYDVFISFKNEDSDLAERIYNHVQKHLKVPFWSKRTLPQLSKSEYEDAIYDALRRSKHFVIVTSKLEYLNANWIKREMASFDRQITEGRKPNSNFVFVVTDDVYRQIIASNKMCLDERYCGYQIIKMSEYEETLMSYIV